MRLRLVRFFGGRARLLDAAYEQFCRLGIQRSSMKEVARGRGLSRITLYRRFATKDALVDQVVMREFRRYFNRFLLEIKAAPTVADRVVLGAREFAPGHRTNPLIGRTPPDELTLLAGSLAGEDRRMLTTSGSSLPVSSAVNSAPATPRTD
ncbi:TetR/AcrR family transcriptional regulator [Rhodococcus ruber]|uniref:TetR/AcrR family transcriptional regulator n=1 Tax=Rhodococcus ruber TaxID=1830 RepID=UPI0019346F55|nr:TetR/AcrR family transcriptional regulator [Rhodococcus ruber]